MHTATGRRRRPISASAIRLHTRRAGTRRHLSAAHTTDLSAGRIIRRTVPLCERYITRRWLYVCLCALIQSIIRLADGRRVPQQARWVVCNYELKTAIRRSSHQRQVRRGRDALYRRTCLLRRFSAPVSEGALRHRNEATCTSRRQSSRTYAYAIANRMKKLKCTYSAK